MSKSERKLWKKNMVALIDTNVILNYITDREDRFRESSKVDIDLCSQGKVDGLLLFIHYLLYGIHFESWMSL